MSKHELEDRFEFAQSGLTYCLDQGFQVHQVDVDDTAQTNMLAHFGECNHIIKQALEKNEGVLIHCQAGISRSATICAAYLMESQKMTADGKFHLSCVDSMIFTIRLFETEAIQTIAAVRSQVSYTSTLRSFACQKVDLTF